MQKYMKQFIIFLTMACYLIACGGSGGDNNVVDDIDEIILDNASDYQMQNTTVLLAELESQTDGLDLASFFEFSYLILAQRQPEDILAEGNLSNYPLLPIELNNISDAYAEQTNTIELFFFQALLEYDRTSLSPAEKISFDVYQAFLERNIELGQFRHFEYPATYSFFGYPGATESFFTEVLTLTNKSEAENYVNLLNQIERRFNQIETLLDSRKDAGIIEPAITLGFSKNAVEAMANSAAINTSYYSRFDQAINALNNISSEDKTALKNKLRKVVEARVLPAYQSLAQKMTSLLTQAPANIGFGQFEGGDLFYNFILRYFTSSNQSVDEIHNLGLQELARIHTEMRGLFDQLGYPQNESIQQLFNRVDTDSGTIRAEDAVAFYEALIAKTYTQLPEAFSVLPVQQVIVVGGQSGGYYIGGSDDGSRPGAFYASTVNDLAYTTQPTLTYHEAVPGHHLQIALASELNLPLFRRKIGFTSFIEGWGLYAERLAKDLGWYQDDIYGDLGRLQFEAMRAARLVIDTGIHAKNWSYNQADQFHIQNVGYSGSIARYSVWPGQATAYMTGMLKILELRDKAQQELAGNYDIRDFHHAVIGNGSMPLNILEQVIDNYINDNLQLQTVRQ